MMTAFIATIACAAGVVLGTVLAALMVGRHRDGDDTDFMHEAEAEVRGGVLPHVNIMSPEEAVRRGAISPNKARAMRAL